MKTYRNEWKYCLSEGKIELLKNRLKEMLSLDLHSGKDDRYLVHSLYFDDYYNTCAKENEAGLEKKTKWRIRYYENEVDNLYLERKEKLYGRCYKEKCSVTKQEYESIINGDVSNIFWKTDQQLLKEFCKDIMIRNFKPKVIIDYERIAYQEIISNVRITLDINISASNEVDKFLESEYQKYPLQIKMCHILEVKFNTVLPGYIKNMICSNSFIQTSFSKYYLGRKKIMEVIY